MAEPVMRFVWFCASGDSCFLGASLMILAVALSTARTDVKARIAVRVLLIVGFVLALLAAIPLVPVYYGVLAIGVTVLAALVGSRRLRTVRRAAQIGVVVLSVLMIGLELRFEMSANPPCGEPLYVIGDSVSAGIQGPNERAWPRLLAKDYGIEVINLAEPGATAASAYKQAERIGDGPGLVFLEIGGNDLFAPTPPAQFREDLTRLVQQVTRPNRTVVMLELPILPWDVQYGRIQRQVAKSLGVALIPKRFFAGVLRQEGSTTDLAHLSARGHQRMADAVARLLGLTEHKTELHPLSYK